MPTLYVAAANTAGYLVDDKYGGNVLPARLKDWRI
jgi:hypothetical protein